MKELSQSKVGVSPFGWGEICYRDFEIFIAGALMIKPGLHYLNTFPDVYKENETYVPITWEMDDLHQKLEIVIENYSDYIEIAENGQRAFLDGITDGEAFVQQVKTITG
jgi:hypothetical protein